MEERKSWPFGEVVAANSEFLTEDLAASGQRNGELFLVRSSPGLGAPCCTSPSRSTAREDRLPDSTPRGGIAACASADLSPVSRARPEPSRAAARPAVFAPASVADTLPHAGIARGGPSWERSGALQTPKQETPVPRTCLTGGWTHPRAWLTQMPCLIRAPELPEIGALGEEHLA